MSFAFDVYGVIDFPICEVILVLFCVKDHFVLCYDLLSVRWPDFVLFNFIAELMLVVLNSYVFMLKCEIAHLFHIFEIL